MTAFQSYLASPKIKRVLNRRPGEKGFSLIELVVVVAVLAILAAVAIPQFTALSDDARLNSAKTTLVNQFKECEFNGARGAVDWHTAVAVGAGTVISGVTFDGDATDPEGPAGARNPNCNSGADGATALIDSGGKQCTIAIDLATGEKGTTDCVGDGCVAGYAGAAGGDEWPETMDEC